MQSRDVRWYLMQLSVIALVLRLVHLASVWEFQVAAPAEIGMDRWLHMHVAQAIAGGHWLGGWSASYDTGPIYGYWLGGLYALSGQHWLPALVVQAILGALTPLLAYRMGSLLYSQSTGLIAATLTTLYVPTIFYELLLVKFALLPATVATMLVCLARARRGMSSGWIFLSGLTLALLTALRANAVLFIPVAVAWVCWPNRRWRESLRTILLVVAGGMVVAGPLAVRDLIVKRRGQGTSLWGIHFYIGNNPVADGSYVPVAGIRDDVVGHVVDARQLAEAAHGGSLSPFEVSLHWFQRGLRFLREEPVRGVVLQARKVWLTYQGGEKGSFGDHFDDYQPLSRVLRLPLLTFGAVCPLAVLGAIVTLTSGRPTLLPLYVATFQLSLLPFFVTGRYRLPLVPAMLVLAAEGLSWMGTLAASRRMGLLAAASGLLVVVLVAIDTVPRDRWIFLLVSLVGTVVAWSLGHRQAGASYQSTT